MCSLLLWTANLQFRSEQLLNIIPLKSIQYATLSYSWTVLFVQSDQIIFNNNINNFYIDDLSIWPRSPFRISKSNIGSLKIEKHQVKISSGFFFIKNIGTSSLTRIELKITILTSSKDVNVDSVIKSPNRPTGQQMWSCWCSICLFTAILRKKCSDTTLLLHLLSNYYNGSWNFIWELCPVRYHNHIFMKRRTAGSYGNHNFVGWIEITLNMYFRSYFVYCAHSSSHRRQQRRHGLRHRLYGNFNRNASTRSCCFICLYFFAFSRSRASGVSLIIIFPTTVWMRFGHFVAAYL